jgi:hypothetical protein
MQASYRQGLAASLLKSLGCVSYPGGGTGGVGGGGGGGDGGGSVGRFWNSATIHAMERVKNFLKLIAMMTSYRIPR